MTPCNCPACSGDAPPDSPAAICRYCGEEYYPDKADDHIEGDCRTFDEEGDETCA